MSELINGCGGEGLAEKQKQNKHWEGESKICDEVDIEGKHLYLAA